MGRDFYKDTYEVKSKLNVLLPESERIAMPAEPLSFEQWSSNSNINWTITQEYLNQVDDVEEDDASEEQTEEESEWFFGTCSVLIPVCAFSTFCTFFTLFGILMPKGESLY